MTVDDHEGKQAFAGRFKLSGDARQSLRQLPGVLSVQTFNGAVSGGF